MAARGVLINMCGVRDILKNLLVETGVKDDILCRGDTAKAGRNARQTYWSV